MISQKESKPPGMQGPRFVFSAFKGFAAYILQHKLQEAGAFHLELAQQHELPLLHQLSHLMDAELSALSLKGVEDFYRQVLDDTAMEKALKELEDWKKNKLVGISREKVELEDLVLSYGIQKQVSLHYLSAYTEDCQQLMLIIQELESYYSQLQRQAFHIFLNIQQEELYQKNQFLSSLIENSLDGIVAFDQQMQVTEWNPALEKSLGISKKAILGKPLMDFFPASENEAIAQAFQKALQGQHVHYPNGTFISTKGFYEANTTPLYDENKNICGGLGVIHDISHRIETEERLKEQQEELQVANEELTEQQEELQAANEELTEQREEIQTLNEELRENLS
jgi:PAS domain S-box-containing protein